MTTGAEGLPRPTRKRRVAAGVASRAHAAASVYLAVAAVAAWDVGSASALGGTALRRPVATT